MTSIQNKYWVVGGQYTDTAFQQLIDGTERLLGPFAERTAALRAWRELTTQSRADCHARYTIAQEAAASPANI